MLIPTCWIELDRTVRSSDPWRFVVLGEVSHVAGDGGLQDFLDVADDIHWKEGKGLDPLERSSDVRAQKKTMSKRQKFLQSPSHNKQHLYHNP